MNNIQQIEQGHSGSFFVIDGEKKVAELTYRKLGKSEIVIDHTHVTDALKGSGTGKSLVEAAVKWARANKIKVVPQCSFAQAVIDKNELLQDVLH